MRTGRYHRPHRRDAAAARRGLAHHVWNDGTCASYRGRSMDVLATRGRRAPCRARQLATGRLDAALWAVLRQRLAGPAVRSIVRERARNLLQDFFGRQQGEKGSVGAICARCTVRKP